MRKKQTKNNLFFEFLRNPSPIPIDTDISLMDIGIDTNKLKQMKKKITNEDILKAIDNDEVTEVSITFGKNQVSFPVDSLTCIRTILHSIRGELYAKTIK